MLLIVVDDLGWADLGCYGAPDALTPRIDALAAQGVRCTDFYVASPVCSASRASLLSGQLPERHGLGKALVESD
ncbi:MAG: sulfatase-like hydrolase/transferase, partial [Planctomycetota bacterium]